MSRDLKKWYGNGKRDCIPFPKSLRKIKRISFKVFLNLKELFKNFKPKVTKAPLSAKNLRPRASRSNNLRPRIHLARKLASTKLKLQHKKNGVNQNSYTPVYEPSSIYQTQNSSFWQWRRVSEWYRYINDPYENIKNINGQ